MLKIVSRLQFVVYSLLFFFFTIHFLLVTNTFAAGNVPTDKQEFGTSYDVIYDINEEGETLVTEKISLKNLTSQYYASQFKLIIGATQISDIKASDEGGVMKTSFETKDNSTIIDVKFNQQVAGINKSLPWTISFRSKDFAEKIGKVWEIRAPKVASTTNLTNYNLTIAVPASFGEPSLISPNPKTQTFSNGKLFLTFTKDQLINSGVSANFGESQLFDFDLTYHLVNNNLFPVLTHIALPPDTAYQDVIFSRIEPKPQNVTIDSDGNYLAWYRLSRGNKININVVGSVKLYTSSKVKNPTLPDSLRRKYTESNKYWEKDNPAILSKLTEILGSSASANLEPQEKIRLIYRYVVNNLKYDAKRLSDGVDRLGALTTLNNPTNAVCIEFTDLFIALARAAGIPARELDGYAYTSNPTLRPLSLSKDMLHAWPEYWSEERGWIMVDPTWENTTGGVDYFSKLDLNHFVFAIKGSSSENPAPAGSYTDLNKNNHDVKINLSRIDFLGKPQIDVVIETPNTILSGFPGKLKVKVTNLGNAVYPSNSLVVGASKLNILNEGQSSGNIPSFGKADFDINFRTTRQPVGLTSLLDSFDDQIVVLIGSQKFIKDIKVYSVLSNSLMPFAIVIVVFLMVLIYVVVLLKHLYGVRKTKKKLK